MVFIKGIRPIVILIFIIFIALSWILYPNYDWLQMTISSLGDPIKNPIGWIFWSIGFTLTGIFIIPIISNLQQKLRVLKNKYISIGISLLYLAAIGIIGLGIIPQFPGEIFGLIHYINASFAMGGLYLGIFFLGLPLVKNKGINKRLIPVAILGWSAPIGFLITQGILLLTYTPGSTLSWLFSFAMWEWILQCNILCAFFILIYIIPEKPI